MLCPSCEAEHSPNQCPQAPAVATNDTALVAQQLESDHLDLEQGRSEMADSPIAARPASRLIEFPGVTRRAMPQWRKELSERVREVQERKAREAALELSSAADEAVALGIEPPPASQPQLELLPPAEAPEINPVLAAALRRIERAHQTATSNSYSRTATAVAIARDHEPEADFTAEVAMAMEPAQRTEPAGNVERTHNLVVVQAPAVSQVEPHSDAWTQPELSTDKPKPKRLIVDDLNDPALSYLDSIGLVDNAVRIEDRAPISIRFVAAIVDVIAVGFLSLPFAALIELLNGNWHQPRIIALMGGISVLLMFFYATVTTALTGRTIGMRLLSLRIVDVRNGLIPTGKQSAGRALIYLLSLATLGIVLLIALARGEGKTAHDRFTRTAVVRG